MRLGFITTSLLILTACAARTNTGPMGATGPTGVGGSACSVQSGPGGVVIACTDGTTAYVYDGLPGIVGPTGTDGQDATPVTVVQLCPGVTVYPTALLEYGICLQGELYGVFSVNGGYMGLIPPGNYTSNAIGSACAFTVGPNCQVTH